MCLISRCILVLLLTGLQDCLSSPKDVIHSLHHLHSHKAGRRHRATNDGVLRFETELYNKKLELNSSGKIHCKVAGGVAPNVTWFLNDKDPLPDGVTSANGTLLVTEASRNQSGQYTCRAVDGDNSIESKIQLDVVVSPRVLEPVQGEQRHAAAGDSVALHCRASGDPTPTIHWDRNRTMLQLQEGVAVEGSTNESNAKFLLLNNGTLLIREVSESDADQYGCTAGSAAGLARNELQLIVHTESDMSGNSGGVAGKAVVVSVSVAGAYMLLVLALMLYCRRRRLKRREAGEKMELEMVEGREKLVEEGEEKKVGNGAHAHNGRLLPNDRDSAADNSEVSAISKASKKSLYDHLTIPKSLLIDQITLGRGEFGEVLLAKIDMNKVKKLKNKEADSDVKLRPVLVKVLTVKDEAQLCEFRRQLELLTRVRHENIARLIGLCNETQPHYMLLEHTDWGDLKSFLLSTRTEEETAEYISRIGPSAPPTLTKLPAAVSSAAALQPHHCVMLAAHLAAACRALAAHRHTHRDIAARNCLITSRLHLKLSYPALSRGPHSHEYYKLHDQVIPLRWLPVEAVAEGDYSTKSDAYMFAATVWEIYTKAELPFAKLNDNSVMERLKSGTLEWSVPGSMPEPLAEILKRCWNNSPADRPQFNEIYEQITEILKEITSENNSQHSQDKIEEDS